MSHRSLAFLISAAALYSIAPVIAQTSNDTIRVTVTMNADGSRTVYQYDNAKHEATATTTDPDGKLRGKVIYQMDDAGRFARGNVFGPDEKFLFKTVYKYDGPGRLELETHLNKDDKVVNKIVYKYSATGKQIGYSVFDSTGKLISGAAPASPTPPSKPRNSLGR